LREELKAAIDADSAAYDAVVKAHKEAKAVGGSGSEAQIDAALRQATNVPLSVAEKSKKVVQIASALEGITNPNMRSDLTTAQALAKAAVTGARANVEINLASLKDQSFAMEVRKKVETFKDTEGQR
jgi:formiminotetrahydrofolate cyclodeaminase